MNDTRPNILWICTDQQRFDTINALGNPYIRTPVLDKLVSEGVAFKRTYCQYPLCTPSRASFLTGRYPSTIHVNYNRNKYFPKTATETLVTRLLAAAGYDCGLIGKLHIADCKEHREPRVDDGYRFFKWSQGTRNNWKPGEDDYASWLRTQGVLPEELLKSRQKEKYKLVEPDSKIDNIPPELHQVTWIRQEAEKFINEAGSPWLLSVNIFDPHPFYDPPWEYYKRYDPDELPGPHFLEGDLVVQKQLKTAGVKFHTDADHPDDLDIKKAKAGYYAMIEQIDHNVGLIIDHLEKTGQKDNTVIIFTSDHGEMMGDHGLMGKGCRFYEGLLRVPLIWVNAKRFKQGLVSDALVEMIDIAPTLLGLANLPVPGLMQGRSLMSILNGSTDPDYHRDFVRSEYYDGYFSTKQVHANMFCDKNFKLITYHGAETGELYDLKNDPWEHCNLWKDENYRNKKYEMIKKSFDATVMASDPGAPNLSDWPRNMSY